MSDVLGVASHERTRQNADWSLSYLSLVALPMRELCLFVLPRSIVKRRGHSGLKRGQT